MQYSINNYSHQAVYYSPMTFILPLEVCTIWPRARGLVLTLCSLEGTLR